MADEESAWQLLLVVPEDPSTSKFGGIRAAAKQRQRAMEKKMDHLFAVNQRVSEALRSRKTYAEVRDLIRRSKVVLEVKKDGAPSSAAPAATLQPPATQINSSYRDQGNLDMYTSENMKAREQNKYHPEVKAAIESFWESLPKTQLGNVNKQIYKWYCRKLFFALVPKATEEEFQKVVEEDWKNDAVWTCTMNSRMFRNAIFQLADIWCETTDPLEYRDFVLKCRDIVAVPPAFKGSREESESTGTTRRATVAGAVGGGDADGAPIGRRRGSSMSNTGSNTPIDAALVPVVEKFSDVEEEASALENLDWEIFEADALAWANVLKELSDYQTQDREDDEEDLLRALTIVQDDRFDLTNDATDRSFAIEKMFMDEIRVAYEQRVQQREKIDAAQASLARPKKSLTAAERQQLRVMQAAKRLHVEDGLYTGVQSSMLKGIIRSREYRNTLLDLQKEAINQRLAKYPNDPAVVLFAGLRLQDQERRHALEADMLDEAFTLYVTLCKDMKDSRELLKKRVADPFGIDFYPNTRTGDHELLKFSSKKWPKAVDWIERLRTRRDEYFDDALEELKEHLKRAQFKGKQHLMALHRQQMTSETKLIDVVATDVTIPHEEKMAELQVLQAMKRDETQRRAREMADFEGLVLELTTKLDELSARGAARKAAEALELKRWRKPLQTLQEAFEATKPVFELYADEISETQLEETMSVTARLFHPGAAIELPTDVLSASDFLLHVIDRSDEWWSIVIAKFASMRHDVLSQFRTWLTNRDAEEQIRIHQRQLQATERRVAQVQGYKAVLKDEAASSKLAADAREVIEERLNLSRQYHELVDSAAELSRVTQSEIERFRQLHLTRTAEQKARVAKLYEQERLAREQFRSLEALRFRRVESCFLRALWLALDKGDDHSRRESVDSTQQRFEEENMERKRLEAERLRRIREKQEQERREMEAARLRRLEEAERERAELQQKKDADVKRRVELRKKQLQERERQQQERLKQERERRKEYQAEVVNNRTARSQSKRMRTHLEIAAENASTTTTPPTPRQPAEEGTAATTKGKVGLRRKSYNTDTRVDAGRATAAQKQVIASSSPKSRVRLAIEQEINSFQNLNTQSMQVNAEDFNHRRIDYFIEEASNQQIYESECAREKAAVVPAVHRFLSAEKLAFQMSRLVVNDVHVNVLTLLDVLRMNPVQTLSLTAVGMDKDQCKKLCQTLLQHPFVSYIDVSNNGELGPHGGQSLLSLVQSNSQITKLTCRNCGIPPEVIVSIASQSGKNAFDRTIGRTEFEFIYSIFRELDTDGSGTITLAELRDYNERHSALQGSRSSSNLRRTRAATTGGSVLLGDSAAAQPDVSETFNKITDAMCLRLDQVRDVLLTLETKEWGDKFQTFDLADLITFVYPSWNRGRAETLVAKYLDDSAAGPNLRELQEFMDAYGTKEGFLSLEQLARGLGEEDVESLRAAFTEADIDEDGMLSLQEFMSFVQV